MLVHGRMRGVMLSREGTGDIRRSVPVTTTRMQMINDDANVHIMTS